MSRINKIISLFIVSVVILSMTSCHGTKKRVEFDVPDNFDTSRNYEVVFWAKNDTNKLQTEIYKKAISDFESFYPNIKVNMRLYTDYNSIYNDVITNIATDTTPNVCITYPDHIATYLTGADTVVNLDELMNNEKYGFGGNQIKYDSPDKDEIIPYFMDECRFGDNYYALPFMRSTEAVYINKDLIEKLGYEIPEMLTWDFMFEVAEKAMEKDNNGNFKINGQKIMIPVIYKSTDNMMITMLKQKNAGYSDNNGNILLFNDITKQLLLDIAGYTKKELFSTFKISSYPGNFLNAGQCIFAIDSTAGATWMGTDAPNIDISKDKLVNFDTVVRPVPQYDITSPKMISQGPSVCVFNKTDPQLVLASWLFAQFLLTNNVQNSYSQTEGYVPVTYKARNTEEFKDYYNNCGKDNDKYYYVKIKASQLLLDNIENTFVTPVFNGSVSLRNAAGELIEDVTKSVRRHSTVNDEYINRLYDKMNSLYRLDQNAATGNKNDMGPLPVKSKVLLLSLGIIWGVIVICSVIASVKRKQKKQ